MHNLKVNFYSGILLKAITWGDILSDTAEELQQTGKGRKRYIIGFSGEKKTKPFSGALKDYSKSLIYEQVQFRGHVYESNLCVSPTKLAN